MAATESLRNLKTASAKATSWTVRCLHPKKGSFKFGPNKSQTMHTHDILLVGEDPTVYCGGTAKDQKEAEIKELESKFKEFTLWKMHKVAFDTRAKTTFMSFPHKLMVELKSTTFDPLQAESVKLPKHLESNTAIKQILNLRDQRMLFDICGFLSEGPLNDRTPMTKSGPKKCADFRLVQKLNGEEIMLALEFSAFEPLCDTLASMVGNWVFVFRLEAYLHGRQKVTCQMDYEAFVVKLPPNGTSCLLYTSPSPRD